MDQGEGRWRSHQGDVFDERAEIHEVYVPHLGFGDVYEDHVRELRDKLRDLEVTLVSCQVGKRRFDDSQPLEPLSEDVPIREVAPWFVRSRGCESVARRFWHI
jgi:hypothetical protein